MPARAPFDRPKYLQLKQTLEEQIRSGQLRAGEKLVSERELMKLHQLSYSTVTRAMAELRNAGLIERRWGSGTFVKPASAMVVNIALAFDQVHRPTDPYLIPIIGGVDEEAPRHEFHWQVFPLAGDSIFETETLFSRLLESRQLHGVVTCSPFPAGDLARLRDMGIPTVTVSNEYPAVHAPWVIEDVPQGVSDMVRHLVDELGHRRIALVMGPPDSVSPQKIRSSGLLAEELLRQLRQRGVVVSEKRIVHTDMLDPQPVTSAVHRWLTDENEPTAIITVVDRYAVEVMNVAAALSVRVPNELSVASWYDEIENSELTAVRVPLKQMGRDAVTMLAKQIAGESMAPMVTPVRLIIRESTAPVKE